MIKRLVLILVLLLVMSGCSTTGNSLPVVDGISLSDAKEQAERPEGNSKINSSLAEAPGAPEETEEQDDHEEADDGPEAGPDASVPEPGMETQEEEERAEEASLLLSGHIICLDPGHCVTPLSGKGYTGPLSPLSTEMKPLYTEGTQGANLTEEQLNLIVGLKLRDRLAEMGAEVLMTREVSEITITGIERCEIANQANADVNIHIHADGVDTPSVHGVSVLVPDGDLLGTPSIKDESVRLGKLMVDAIAEETGAKNRGISYRSDMSGFNFSEVPSVLLEMGFMTNPEEDALLETDEYQNKIVNGIIKSLLQWYGLELCL